jgi:hypothetical protein
MMIFLIMPPLNQQQYSSLIKERSNQWLVQSPFALGAPR